MNTYRKRKRLVNLQVCWKHWMAPGTCKNHIKVDVVHLNEIAGILPTPIKYKAKSMSATLQLRWKIFGKASNTYKNQLKVKSSRQECLPPSSDLVNQIGCSCQQQPGTNKWVTLHDKWVTLHDRSRSSIECGFHRPPPFFLKKRCGLLRR